MFPVAHTPLFRNRPEVRSFQAQPLVSPFSRLEFKACSPDVYLSPTVIFSDDSYIVLHNNLKLFSYLRKARLGQKPVLESAKDDWMQPNPCGPDAVSGAERTKDVLNLEEMSLDSIWH